MQHVPEITIAEAQLRVAAGEVKVLDIRDEMSFEEAHIPGAERLTNESVATLLAETDRAQPLVVCCYHGHSSQSATMYLLDQGFTDVRSLRGGFEGWRQAAR